MTSMLSSKLQYCDYPNILEELIIVVSAGQFACVNTYISPARHRSLKQWIIKAYESTYWTFEVMLDTKPRKVPLLQPLDLSAPLFSRFSKNVGGTRGAIMQRPQIPTSYGIQERSSMYQYLPKFLSSYLQLIAACQLLCALMSAFI